MEGFNWQELLVPAAVAVVGFLVGRGYPWLREYVAATPNKVDDAVLKAFEEGYEQAHEDMDEE